MSVCVRVCEFVCECVSLCVLVLWISCISASTAFHFTGGAILQICICTSFKEEIPWHKVRVESGCIGPRLGSFIIGFTTCQSVPPLKDFHDASHQRFPVLWMKLEIC